MSKYCFFFQAEDGIRDLYVTGVQTCALPISRASADHAGQHGDRARQVQQRRAVPPRGSSWQRRQEIGRASCRERVEISGAAAASDDKKRAMMVEDHPYDYRTFEGIITKGQYG